MSGILPAKGNSAKILLLRSYDRDTLGIVKRLSNRIIRDYGSEDYEWSGRIIPIIARNVQVYHTESGSQHYCILSQQYKDKWSLTIFKNRAILDRIQCDKAEYDQLLERTREIAIASEGKYVEMKATFKIIELSKWSDIIFIEKRIELSWMAKEMIELGKIRSHQFGDFEELWELTRKELAVLIKSKGFEMVPIR